MRAVRRLRALKEANVKVIVEFQKLVEAAPEGQGASTLELFSFIPYVDWAADLPRGSVTCAASGCAVRDIHAHADLGRHVGGFTARALAAHDSMFIIVRGSPAP